MYRTTFQQYPPISQSRPGMAYSSAIPPHRAPNMVGAGSVQPTGAVSFLRPSQNPPYGFSSVISQPQTQSSSLQQPQSLGSGLHSQSANDSQQLDLNDFPALGAGATAPTTAAGVGAAGASNAGNHVNSSYAAQAQHHSAPSQSANQALGNGVARDFTNPEDFPALGGQTTGHDGHIHVVNGYQSQQPQQQHSLGSVSILRNNLLQPDDKRQAYGSLKQNPPTPSSWSQNPAGQAAYTQSTNGVSQQQPQSAAYAQHQQAPQASQPGGQLAQEDSQSLDPGSTANQQQLVQPHTPADQVLHSAADRWGLLALVRALRSQTDDALSSGQDLGLLGMELDNPGSLYTKFATPWADYGSSTTTEPNYHLPSCYNVAPPPPNPKKASQFSEETLFFTFYSMPRDVFQELAAQELYNRHWRYHKGQRLWITTEGVTSNDLTRQGVDGTMCIVWDVDAWEKQQRMLRIDLRELELRENSSTSTNLSNSGSAVGAVGAERGPPGLNVSGPAQLPPQQQQGSSLNPLAHQQQQQQQQFAQSLQQQHLRH